MSETIKTCRTCGHSWGSKCGLSGYYKETERKYPTSCGRDYRGWVPKMGLIARVKMLFHGYED